jgi:hypothetical protein
MRRVPWWILIAGLSSAGCSRDDSRAKPPAETGLMPAAPVADSEPVAPPIADSLYRQGSALIQANCGECYQARAEGLTQGIALVDRALAEGFPDSAAAFLSLAEAYRPLAFVYAEPDSPDQRAWRSRLGEVLHAVARLRPGDAGAAYEYAMSLERATDRAAALERVLQIDSTHGMAAYVLGLELTEMGDTARGLPLLFRAGLALSGPDAIEFTPQVVLVLREHGRRMEGDSIARIHRNRQRAAQHD